MSKLTILMVAGLVTVLSGCTMLDSRPPEEIVAERSLARVEALMDGDYDAAYVFTTPGYQSIETSERYGIRWAGVGMWEDVIVRDVTCLPAESPNLCKLSMEVRFKAMRQEEQTTALFEDWVLMDGVWYFSQKRL